MKLPKAILILFLLFYGSKGYAQLGGNNTYEFLNLPQSARITALGGNLISVRDNDLNTALSNPSLISDSMSGNVSMSFTNYIADVKYGSVATAKHLKHGGNFCIGLNYLDYGKITPADVNGAQSGSSLTANETCFNLAWSHAVIDSNFTLGVNVKTIFSHLDAYASIGSAIDFGVTYYNPINNFTVAGVIKNTGKIWKPYVEGHKEKLPFEIQLGISFKPKFVPIRLSVIYENLEKWDLIYSNPAPPSSVNTVTGEIVKENKSKVFGDKLMRHFVFGTEFIITKNIFLQAGYNYQRKVELANPAKTDFSGFSFGFGFRVYKFHFSYGRAVYNLMGATNNFSVCFDVNSFYSK